MKDRRTRREPGRTWGMAATRLASLRHKAPRSPCRAPSLRTEAGPLVRNVSAPDVEQQSSALGAAVFLRHLPFLLLPLRHSFLRPVPLEQAVKDVEKLKRSESEWSRVAASKATGTIRKSMTNRWMFRSGFGEPDVRGGHATTRAQQTNTLNCCPATRKIRSCDCHPLRGIKH